MILPGAGATRKGPSLCQGTLAGRCVSRGDSFGNTTNSTDTLTNYFRCVACEFDTGTNVFHYRAGYYDPHFGWFIAEDPI